MVTIESTDGIVRNSVFAGILDNSSSLAGPFETLFDHCIYTDPSPEFGDLDIYQETILVDESELFGEILPTGFNENLTYTLTISDDEIKMYTLDGSICGLEGGLAPWPEDYQTGNPFIWPSSTVAPITNSDGLLPVQITVSTPQE